jgi:aarF domain-containing kinase
MEQKFSTAEEKKVPSTSIGRAFEFTKVGTSILTNVVGSALGSSLGLKSSNTDESFVKNHVLSEKNAERLSITLCKMRGAALKIGQALSMQEDYLVPPQVKEAFEKARQSANIMPESQLSQVMASNFGNDWEDNFLQFNKRPFAAASIGQVHKAQLKDGTWVAMKVQYPGVANSIDSDLNNLKRLMDYTGVFPKTMFLDDFIANTRVELKEECDYEMEAEKQIK